MAYMLYGLFCLYTREQEGPIRRSREGFYTRDESYQSKFSQQVLLLHYILGYIVSNKQTKCTSKQSVSSFISGSQMAETFYHQYVLLECNSTKNLRTISSVQCQQQLQSYACESGDHRKCARSNSKCTFPCNITTEVM